MGNSTFTIQNCTDYAKTYPDLNPVLSVGGFSAEPALTIANDVATAMMSPPFGWKWNRKRVPFFYTNSFQQDYAIPGLNDVSWLEFATLVDVNNTAQPKPRNLLETVRELPESSVQYGLPGQVCWMPNSQLSYGTWGGGALGFGTASNPGPGITYLPLISSTAGAVLAQPVSPFRQIVDPNGNFWVLTNALTQSVTLGNSQPSWPTTVVYPTFANPNAVATTVNDGTAVWTALNPNGQGMRLNPIPSQQGRVWQAWVYYQIRPPQFTNLRQTIDPIPDDMQAYFRRGFIAYAYMHAKDPKVARKFQDQQALWIGSLRTAVTSGDRERDNAGLYPSEAIMQQPGAPYLGPAAPYYPAL